SGTPFQLMHRVLEEPPDVAGLDERLRPLVLRAMDKDAERRPSAYQLLMDLVGGAGDPVAATTAMLRTTWPAAPEPPPEPTPPEPAAAPTVPSEPAEPPTLPVERRRRRGRALLAAGAALVVALAAGTAIALSGHGGDTANQPGPSGGQGSVGPSGTVATQDIQ